MNTYWISIHKYYLKIYIIDKYILNKILKDFWTE